MSFKTSAHPVQTSILRELLFRPQASYGELQKPTGLTSDHFNFHINRLLELGLVDRVVRGRYCLTSAGKELANRLDTDNNQMERQPKCAVVFALERSVHGTKHYVFQERLKHPFYGFWSLPSGKIRWGESIIEAARREALEETGLQADFTPRGVYHERVLEHESERLLEDKIFFIVHGTNVHGELQVNFEGGYNEWLTPADMNQRQKQFDSFQYEQQLLNSSDWLIERTTHYSAVDF